MMNYLSNIKEYITRKDMKDRLTELYEENDQQEKRIEELEGELEDKKRALEVKNKKFKEIKDALDREHDKYKMRDEALNRVIDESNRKIELKDEKISRLKEEVEFHGSKMREMEKSHKSKMKEMEKSHKSKMKEMEKKMSAMNDEVEKEKRVARKLMSKIQRLRSKIQRLSKQIVKEDNRWEHLGVSEKDGEKMYHFRSPIQDVEKEAGTESAQIYKIPGKLNLSALEKTVVEEDDIYAYIEDKENNLSFRMPYQLYRYIRELLGKVVKEKYSGMDLEMFGKPLRLPLLELREKKEPERESKIKRIEKFGRLNAGRELSIKEIADKCGVSTEEAGMPLSRLRQRGVCRRVKRGCYIFKKAAD